MSKLSSQGLEIVFHGMKIFRLRAQDREFKDWLVQHPDGFYLNEGARGNIRRKVGDVILHRSSCHHLGDGEGVIGTTYAKVVSDKRDQLKEWANSAGFKLRPCKSCTPFDDVAPANPDPHSLSDPMARYPWGALGTPHTDPSARVRSFRMVVGVRAVRITGGFYRSASADGTFELYTPALMIQSR